MTLDLDRMTGPVLIVAPHPDDETLGCGGLIAALSQRDIVVHTVFVTDGGASHRNSRAWPRDRLAAIREAEASKALELLGAGYQPRSFMHLPDAAMPALDSPSHRAALTAAVGLVRQLQPALMILPWRRDPHCDHRDSWCLFSTAMPESGVAAAILEYTIWLDELGGPGDFPEAGEVERIDFNIAPYLITKRHAITAHRSQLGALITDDPEGFFLTQATLDRLIKPIETYWRPCPAA